MRAARQAGGKLRARRDARHHVRLVKILSKEPDVCVYDGRGAKEGDDDEFKPEVSGQPMYPLDS